MSYGYRGASQPAAPRISSYRSSILAGSTFGNSSLGRAAAASSGASSGTPASAGSVSSAGVGRYDTSYGMGYPSLTSPSQMAVGGTTSNSTYGSSSSGAAAAAGGGSTSSSGGGGGSSAATNNYLSGYSESTQRLLRAADESSAQAHRSGLRYASYNAPSAMGSNVLNYGSGSANSSPSIHQRAPSAGLSSRAGAGAAAIGLTSASQYGAHRGSLPGIAGSNGILRKADSLGIDSDDDLDGPHVSLATGHHGSGTYTPHATTTTSSYPYGTQLSKAVAAASSTSSVGRNSVATSPMSQISSTATASVQMTGPIKVPVGLRNIGNTCYMNASLQCIVHGSGLFLRGLEQRSSSSGGGGGGLFSSFSSSPSRSKLSNALVGLSKQSNINDLMAVKGGAAHLNHEFSGGRQNDAHEFIREFVHALHNEVNRVGKAAYKEMKDIDGESDSDAAQRWFSYFRSHDDSVVTDFFGGFMRSTTVCGSCSKRSLSFSPVWDLSLSMQAGSRNTVQDMIAHFMRVETLDNASSFHCDKCKQKRTGKKQSLLVNWPKVLVLQLMRFTHSGARNSHQVEFPARLESEAIPMPSQGLVQGAVQPSGYTLSGVVLHKGTANFGHYTAMVKPIGSRTWYNCDDSFVTQINESEVLRQKVDAYLLFYVMDDQ